jgi:RNA polymerase sigma-70 factor (ECF subfamily)
MLAATSVEPNLRTSPALMPQASETDLFSVWARRIRASDPTAFEAFFRAVHGALLRYAQRFVRDESLAADMVQDAFVRIWDGRERIDPGQSLKAFAYRTVRNLCLNRLRDLKTRETLLSERYEAPAGRGNRPDEQTDGSLLADLLESWIEELPERQREALRLSRLHGLSHEEVAEAMDVSPRTVNNHLVKALRTIRDRVNAYEPTLLDV